MLLAVKTKLKLTEAQKVIMSKHAGIARFTFNWGLGMWNALYKDGYKPSVYALKKFFNDTIKTDSHYSWIKEESICQKITQFAFDQLGDAFSRFFKGLGKYPNFKKKNRNDSFTIDASGRPIHVGGTRIKLPTIGWVKTFEGLPHVTIKKITISKQAASWYISFSYEQKKPEVLANRIATGADLGISALVTLADGTSFDNERAFYRYQDKLAALQRRLAKKEKGSSRASRLKNEIAKLHQRISNIRKDTIHKMTNYICKNHAVIGIEDLNVSGMLKNGKLSKALSDASLYEIGRQIKYKGEKFSCFVHIVDRFFPSTKKCPQCGAIHDMPLSKRVYECTVCGWTENRDKSAAINLMNEAIKACGTGTQDTDG
jgi:putative transposase